tara:strand:+ start:642 stop:2162 length:1521 start_codon:yes stop_codon:yes gene_type:complete
MPRIHTIVTDTTVQDVDILVGSDGDSTKGNVTRNYTVGSLKKHILTTGIDGSFSGNLTVGGNTTISGNLSVVGNATIDGNLTFGNADTDTVAFGADIVSNIIPDVTDTYNLGTSSKEWKNIHLSGTARVGGILLNGANNEISGAGEIYGYKFIDSQDSQYFIDPNAATSINVVGKIQGGSMNLGNININTSAGEISGVTDIYAQKIYDSNDNNYFLDPTAGISLKVKGNIQLGDSAAETNAEITSYGDLILKADIDADGGQCLTTYKTRFNQVGGTDIQFNVNQSGWCGGTFVRSAFNDIQVGDVVHGLNAVGPSGQTNGAASRAITQIIGFQNNSSQSVDAADAVKFVVRTGGPVYYDASQSLTVLGSGVAFNLSGSKNIKFFSGASEIASINKDGKLTVEEIAAGNIVATGTVVANNTDTINGININNTNQEMSGIGEIYAYKFVDSQTGNHYVDPGNSNVSAVFAGKIRMVVPTFADDSAAGSGGLVAGDVYKTSGGDLKIKL